MARKNRQQLQPQMRRPNAADNFTTLRAGALGTSPDAARDEMFIDPSPYCSLSGFQLSKTARDRSSDAAKNPRSPVNFGDAARHRSCGKKSGGNPHTTSRITNVRGAPPHPTR